MIKKMLMITIISLLFITTGCSAADQGNTNKESKKIMTKIPTSAPKADDPSIPEGNHIRIDLDIGSITLELYPDVAPNTVANFKVLTASGFYDGVVFHRVIPGFMAQGGDPDGKGTGGPGYSVDAEFNDKKHLRGSLAMARSSSPNSAGSQFYICFGPQPHLDNQYTIFGMVTEGMDIVDQLKNGSVMNKVHLLP
ncbi:MAG: peptidylprolyl isomerase [Mariprofundaceae bacterium]